MRQARQAGPFVRTCRPRSFSVPPPTDLPGRPDGARFAVRVQVPERDPWEDRRAEHEEEMRRLRALLTSTAQLEADLPAPLAFEEIKARRAGPLNAYNRELRHPIWAPAMEASVGTFLEQAVARHLPGLRWDVECRTSSCRVTLRPSAELDRRLSEKYGPSKRPFAIFGELIDLVGFLGRTMRETLMEDGSVSVVFAFDASGMPPDGYRHWQKRGAEITAANLAAARRPEPSH